MSQQFNGQTKQDVLNNIVYYIHKCSTNLYKCDKLNTISIPDVTPVTDTDIRWTDILSYINTHANLCVKTGGGAMNTGYLYDDCIDPENTTIFGLDKRSNMLHSIIVFNLLNRFFLDF